MTQNDANLSLERQFKFFAVKQRVLAQNPDGKLIDIGALEAHDRKYTVVLDVDPLEVKPAPSVQAALKETAARISFDYLDGLFTSEGIADYPGQLQEYPHILFSLEEPVSRTLTDPASPHLF
jgi:hypothetical protein